MSLEPVSNHNIFQGQCVDAKLAIDSATFNMESPRQQRVSKAVLELVVGIIAVWGELGTDGSVVIADWGGAPK